MSSTFTRLNGLMFKNIPSRLLPVDFAVRMHVVKSDQTGSTAHVVAVCVYSFCVAVVITSIVTLGWVALSENPGRRVQAWKLHRVRTACLFIVVILAIWGALLIRVATN